MLSAPERKRKIKTMYEHKHCTCISHCIWGGAQRAKRLDVANVVITLFLCVLGVYL